ncbi:MAG: acetolactate decarboxylase [Candidatus Dadabacteria bacterium]|nr:acetolactate decarboxylase [Candidatus Dadabacteria bacterium]NIX15013.1 acetolactate decarboxylase [Candidatus Dadabacteria bacterium]
MNSFVTLISILIIGLITLSCVQHSGDLVYQESTLGKLDDGEMEGMLSMGDLKKHGDFGIGTFDGLDGEMVALDGEFFQVDYQGESNNVNEKVKTPFAMVTFFESDKSIKLTGEFDYKLLKTTIDEILPSRDIIYAIKIIGEYQYLQTRSVPKQEKPYPPLREVVKQQKIFNFKDIKGTAVGFWVPKYMKNINVPGYHFHFITEDKTTGGHVLELNIKDPTVQIDFNTDLHLSLFED